MMGEKLHKKRKFDVFTALMFAVMAVWTLVFLALLLWGLITSFKTWDDFAYNIIGFPEAWTFDNYISVVQNFYVNVRDTSGVQSTVYFPQLFLNTILYVGLGAFAATLIPFIMAYLNTKFNYRFNNVIYAFVVIAMIMPVVNAAPSELRILRALGLFDTWLGIVVSRSQFLSMTFLVLHSAFRAVPNEMSEAAYVDGASEFRVMVQIVMPLAVNAFGVMFLTTAITYWNEFQVPMLYMPTHPTLAVGFYELSKSTVGELSNVPSRIAGCFILLLPILILFIIFHDKMMKQISFGGIKG